MELRQLRYFVAVAQECSFSRAARRLHVSQPPLSVQIKSLEAQLGVRLLERGNRGVSPTAAGRVFLEQALSVLGAVEHAREETLRAYRGETGTLSVGFVSIADYGVLPPALKSFRASFPEVQVELHELTTDAQIPQLRARRLDLGIALAPVDAPDLEFDRLLSEELVLAVPSGHAAARGESAIDLRTLSRESFIVPPRDIAPGLYDLTIGLCRSFGFAPRITQQARQMQTVIGLVSSGMGFALVPSSVRNLRRPGVRYRRLRRRAASIELGVLRLRNPDNPASGHFIEALRRASRAD